ncbi:MAG: hypothetical protein Q9163_005040 [Psora crenata]
MRSGRHELILSREIRYDGQDYWWGYQIADSAQRHQWFKLNLDPYQTRGTELAKTYPVPISATSSEHSAEKLTTDYLTALKKHAEHVLRYTLPRSALVSTPVEYILTVPAVWSDAAQAKTRQCAENAGMGQGSTIQMVSEPEAAAIYTLADMDILHLKIGDTFVVCDAGGGTVDLITYTITQLHPTLKLTEATPGNGALCGSSYLNRRFQAFIEKKLGQETGWDEAVLEDVSYRCTSLPGLMNNATLGISRSKLRLLGTDVRTIFEPVLSEVLGLIMAQITATTKPITAVLMVGGFSENAYLRDLVRKEIRSNPKSKDAEVLKPKDGWTAVVRGALMKGLSTTSISFPTTVISGRRARKHYGIYAGTTYESVIHDHRKRYWDAFDGNFRIRTFSWFVKKGIVIEEEKPVRLDYYSTKLKSDGPLKEIVTSIHVCKDPENRGAPMYKNSEVSHLVDVKADLKRIPTHKIPVERGHDGRLYYVVRYQIQITHYSANTTYELIYGHVNYGQVTAEWV